MIETTEITSQELALWFECYRFLALEAEYLDDDRVDDWLQLLTPDITYEMPIRVTRRRREDPIGGGGWHMKESFGSLHTRVARLGTTSAWGEDPPSRTRRFVSNIRCGALSGEEVEVKSNLMLYRGRGDSPEYVLLTAERRDVLRRTENGLRLARRLILLSHTTLPTQNLGVFL
jgi:ethylbenzene dioxygenase beta subunit